MPSPACRPQPAPAAIPLASAPERRLLPERTIGRYLPHCTHTAAHPLFCARPPVLAHPPPCDPSFLDCPWFLSDAPQHYPSPPPLAAVLPLHRRHCFSPFHCFTPWATVVHRVSQDYGCSHEQSGDVMLPMLPLSPAPVGPRPSRTARAPEGPPAAGPQGRGAAPAVGVEPRGKGDAPGTHREPATAAAASEAAGRHAARSRGQGTMPSAVSHLLRLTPPVSNSAGGQAGLRDL